MSSPLIGIFADFMIRNKLAKKVSKTQMLENLARSKELGLVLQADNVKNRIGFMCHCDTWKKAVFKIRLSTIPRATLKSSYAW